MKDISIYIHIPFCMSKCSYCSFVSKCAGKQDIDEYFKILNAHIIGQSAEFKNRKVKTIYIGGGTPSFVDASHIKEVLNNVFAYYNVATDAEISIECNPSSATKEKLCTYKDCGINRISFGVQSLDDQCLKIIGRRHNANMALTAINLAKEVGFNNISCDLLIGIVGQTKEILIKDIKTLAQLGVKHISAYMLMLEEGTKLYEQVVINHTYDVANDDECVNMYNCAYNCLKNLGFNRYEISNFAISGYECRHNINYWDCGEYVGFGVSAYSYYDNMRIDCFCSFDEYYKYVRRKFILRMPVEHNLKNEVLTKTQKIEEYIMLGLRQAKGINLHKLKNLGFDLLFEKKETMEQLLTGKFIKIECGYLSITPQNFGACNQIILMLLP